MLECIACLAILYVMNPLHFSIQNIVDGQGIPIAITGMVIVFCVLTLISLFIVVLPKLTAWLSRYFPETEIHEAATPETSSNDTVMAAIAYVYHMRRQEK